MTLQEIFDKSCLGIIHQGLRASTRPTVIGDYECLYRGGDLKCAAGFILPDEEYSPKLEGLSVVHIAWFQEHFSFQALQLLDDLQNAHDRYLPVYAHVDWKDYIDMVAKDFNLSTATIDAAYEEWRAKAK